MSFAGDIVRGKTLGRALFNAAVVRHARELEGRVLDLAGGGSYEPLLPKGIDLVRSNITAQGGMEVVDFNKPLPFADGSFDHVLLFNALYIAEDPQALLREMRRVVRVEGSILIASPFLQNEMREPHDYMRLTSEGLARLYTQSGFQRFEIIPLGERFSVAANLLHNVWYFSIVRFFVYGLARGLDRLLPQRMRARYPAPLGYFCILYT